MIDRRIGHYRVIAKLGEGGMGQVYSAHDEKLNRTVALKWISPALLPDEKARRMFIREARAAAALDHPFICSVHEVLDDAGQPVIVMERVDGQTLDDRIRRGPLPFEELQAKAVEIAEALASAHERGIVHRDIKCGNIMVTSAGHVKVMDFGLAIIVTTALEDETVARSAVHAGGVVGTLPYLAPEVLRGDSASPSSDLYALGIVLYEMATARRPFDDGSNAVLISDILNRAPRSPRILNSAIPRWLEELILDLLAKQPTDRPRSAGEVIARLRSGAVPALRSDRRSVAVLPFHSLTRDPESAHLGVGLADATTSELAMFRSLLVRPTAAILRYDNRDVDPIEAGRELGVSAVVAGTFQRAGQRVRVTVQLIDVAEQRPLWSAKIDNTLDDIFAMQDEVSRKIAEALQVQLTPADERRAARRVQPGGEAVEAYMKGRIALLQDNVGNIKEAIESFALMRDLEPDNPLGWLGLADAYARLAFSWEPDRGWYERAKSMCEHAVQLAPSLPEVRYVRARLAWSPKGGFDHDFALSEFAATIAERPNMNEAFDFLALTVAHLGLTDEARALYQRALIIDPNDDLALSHISFVADVEGDFKTAAALAGSRNAVSPTAWTYYIAARALCRYAPAEAAATLDEAEERFPNSVLYSALRAVLAAQKGDVETALGEIDRTEKNRKSFGHFHHAELDVACAFALLGRTDDAMRYVTSVVDGGFPSLPTVEKDSLLDSIRSHADYQPLISRLRSSRQHFENKFASLRHLLSNS